MKRASSQTYSAQWPPDVVARCLDLWADGLSIEDIADRLGRPAPGVARQVLSRHYAQLYDTLWTRRRLAGERRPVISLAEIVDYGSD